MTAKQFLKSRFAEQRKKLGKIPLPLIASALKIQIPPTCPPHEYVDAMLFSHEGNGDGQQLD